MSETKVGKAEVRVSVKLAESGKYYCTLQYFINGEAMVINQYHQEKAIVWGPYDTEEQANKMHSIVEKDVDAALRQLQNPDFKVTGKKRWVEGGTI